jgi:acetate---CoA ligase (ADP-forming)
MARMATVRSLIFPRSLAVVGASPRNVDAVETVLRSGLPAWGVNPNHDEVAGLRCFARFDELPETPECAFLLVNHERVEQAFEDAVAAGVRAFVVPGVGAEAGGAAGPTRERLARRAREVDAAMVGPNCMGVVVPNGPMAWIGRPPDTTAPGTVAALAQSGSIADAFLSLGGRVGFRCVVSSGAEAVTDVADYLDFFAEDEGTHAIGLFLESVRRPEAFVAGLERCALAEKTVVCLKVGRSEAGARAALTHTGAIVGSARAFSAVLRRYEAVEVDDFHELVETLELLGRGGRPRGSRLAGISESGGECALLADQAAIAGIPFAPLRPDLATRLREEFPNYLDPGNPLDAWAIADESVVYPRSLELLAESGAFDVLIAQADLSQFRDETNDGWCELTVRTLAALRERTGVSVAATTVHSADPPRMFQELARELELPLLREPRQTMLALARTARLRPYEAGAPEAVLPDLDDLLEADGPLREHESSLALERLGVTFARRARAATPEEASARARELGPPMVVKLDGPGHKSRFGGVILGVTSPEDAAEAARRLDAPVLVAEQVDGGAEVFCGMTRDPDYGPVLIVGTGGAGVESADGVLATVSPLSLEHARDLVADAGIEDETGAVARVLLALDALARVHPEVQSVDVNPLVLTSEGAIGVDALVVVDRRC